MTRKQEPKGERGADIGTSLPATEADALKWKTNPMLLTAKFPDELANNPHALAQFLGVATAVDLNPFLGEIVPIHGRPYITEEGWLRMIDERAPGQLVFDQVSMASKEEAAAFGVKGGWLGKAIVVRRIQTLDGKTADRTVTDWFFLSTVAVENSPITAITDEPWRHAMKGAHVRALRKAFRDVVARAAHEYAVGGGTEEGQIIDAEVVRIVDKLALQGAEASTEDTERKRFWARATKAGYRNGSPEVAALLDLPEAGVGAIKEHWIDAGHTWMEANVELDKALGDGPPKVAPTGDQCSECGKLITTADDMMYTSQGMVMCSGACGEEYDRKHQRKEPTSGKTRKGTTRPRKR